MIGETLIATALITFVLIAGVWLVAKSIQMRSDFVVFFSVLYWVLLIGLLLQGLGI